MPFRHRANAANIAGGEQGETEEVAVAVAPDQPKLLQFIAAHPASFQRCFHFASAAWCGGELEQRFLDLGLDDYLAPAGLRLA